MNEKPLRDIEFGEPDANAEYFGSLRAQKEPMYLAAWVQPEILDFDKFETGQKFIIYGQKGTGKTAILRRLESEAKKREIKTEFVVFKTEVLQESDLIKLDQGAAIDDERIKTGKFYYHYLKRIMLSIIISKMGEKPDNASEELNGTDPEQKSFITSLFGVSGKDAVRLGFDSIVGILQSIRVDQEKINDGRVKIEPATFLKKSNETLLKYVVSRAKTTKPAISIYVDELHFAFRNKKSLTADTQLVRDTVIAAQALNEKFSQEGINITIYLSLRQEFLDQPEIAKADIVQVIESYGCEISWANYPATTNHPIFKFIARRISNSLQSKLTSARLFSTYFSMVDEKEFLDYTWSKPRDIVRFFKTARDVCPGSINISKKDYGIAIRHYANASWTEIKSALGAFLPTEAIPYLETALKVVAEKQLSGIEQNISDFEAEVQDALAIANNNGTALDKSQFTQILYILGLIYFVYNDANGQLIYHRYHRGNRTPSTKGQLRLHEAICKAIS